MDSFAKQQINQTRPYASTGWIHISREPANYMQRCIIWHPTQRRPVFAIFVERDDLHRIRFHDEGSGGFIFGVTWWQPEPETPNEPDL